MLPRESREANFHNWDIKQQLNVEFFWVVRSECIIGLGFATLQIMQLIDGGLLAWCSFSANLSSFEFSEY